MTDKQLLIELAKFFLEEFSNDPGGVADWIIQRDFTPEEIYYAAKSVAER